MPSLKQTKTSITFATLLCALCLALSALPVNAQAQTNGVGVFEQPAGNIKARSEEQKTALAGSWLCDNTSLSGDVIKTLQAFTEDGRAFVTGQGDTVPPVLSPQFGSWEHREGRTFDITVLSIAYDPQGPPPAGTLVGTAKIRETVTLDRSGNKFSGRFKFVLSDPAGNVLYTNDGTFHGSRIKVEPLN